MFLISLLRSHRWLPSTLGTVSPRGLAFVAALRKLFNHIAWDSALGTLPSMWWTPSLVAEDLQGMAHAGLSTYTLLYSS